MTDRALAPRLFLTSAVAILAMLFARQARADDKVYDVAVSGGGPAGVMAALSAVANGAKSVVVLDKRSGVSGRPQTLVVEASTVAQFKRFGIDPTQDRRFVPLKNIAFRPRGDVEGLVTHPSTEGIGAAGPGAHPTMLALREPVALLSIDDAVDILREAAAKVPEIELREGVEVRTLEHSGNEIKLTTAHDAEAGGAAGTKQGAIVARYHFNATGSSGPTYGGTKQTEGHTYAMGTAVLHDPKPERAGNLVFTMVKHDNRSYRVIIGGRPGQTTMNFDLPDNVDRNDPVAVNKLVTSFAKQSGFYGKSAMNDPAFKVDLVRPASVYDAQRTNATAVVSGPKGRENNMNGGDNLVTATPWPGLGFNHGVHIGSLFGDFYARAEGAKNPQQRRAVGSWVEARAATQILAHHVQDRITHVIFPAPQTRGIKGKVAVVKDVAISAKQGATAAAAIGGAAKESAAYLGRQPQRIPRAVGSSAGAAASFAGSMAASTYRSLRSVR